MIRRAGLAILLAFATVASAPRIDRGSDAVGSFVLSHLPVLPGSVLPLELQGLVPPYDVDVLGPGRLDGTSYVVPNEAKGGATLYASNAHGFAMHAVGFASPPSIGSTFIAVATYDDGVVLHDASAPFTERSVLGIGGAPSDVAIDSSGAIGAAATNGLTAAVASIDPWHVAAYSGVPFGDEVAFDEQTHALYVSDRDLNGAGAITRIAANGSILRRTLGVTAEGIAIDPRRRRVYVANVNDGTISIVDADSLVEIQRFKAIARVFSLALNADGTRLYATSNQSYSSPFAAAGSAIEIDVSGSPRVVARSGALTFPLGVAVDDRDGRVFVTDEHDDDVYVLDARTMRAVHAPLPTCRTPWKPRLDDGKLFIPCARADEVDVLDASTLARMHGAPFATGGYPLAVAVWHPPASVKR